MKNIVIVLIYFFIIACFSFAGLKEDVVNLLKAKANEPLIIFDFDPKPLELSDELMSLAISNGFDYIRPMIWPEHVSSNITHEIDRNFDIAKAADNVLRAMDPATLIPLLFQILEEGSLGTNEYVEVYSNWYDGSQTQYIGTYGNIKITKERSEIYPLACGYINRAQRAYTKSKDWYLTELWAKYYHPSIASFPYFWWYEGRKYATNIWEDFERCWQYEQARTVPRASVLRLLAKEIAELGISALPIVKSKIENGDTTLDPVLKALAEKLEDGGITNSSFITWYNNEGSKYILPPCEGLEAAKVRIADTNYVNELNGVFSLGSPVHKTVRLDDANPDFMKDYLDQMLAYFTNRPPVPKHWYYKLPDDVLEVDEGYVYELDRCCTNYNPRYLTPATE